MSTETQARGWVSDLSPNGYLTLSLTPTLALTLPPRSRSLTLPRSLGLSFLLFGRGMKGPERGHVRDTTALPWERTVAIFAVMTTQRNQPVACCLSHKLHLCVRPSQLGHREASTSVPSCVKRHHPQFDALRRPPPLPLEGLSTSVPSCVPPSKPSTPSMPSTRRQTKHFAVVPRQAPLVSQSAESASAVSSAK